MFPAVSIGWLGSVTKLPGRTPASSGMNKPPAAASKIVTLTTSPMPKVISGGGRLSPKVTAMPPGPYSPTASTTSGLNLMMLYWGPDCVEPELISPLEGADSDRIVHPLTARSNAHKRDFAPRPSILTFVPDLTHAFR